MYTHVHLRMSVYETKKHVICGRVQESSKVGEENAGLRQQLANVQASLHQLTNTNQATLQDAEVSFALPISNNTLKSWLPCDSLPWSYSHKYSLTVLQRCFNICCFTSLGL